VELTDAGVARLCTAECALAAVENEVLGALDETQRETLYSLLEQAAANGGPPKCTEAVNES
jgi:hypothetical protein